MAKIMNRPFMIQGTSSHCGKTIFTAGLARLLANKGYKVCPFKAQNISDHTLRIHNGYEIGYAQYLQAIACRILPDERMNPILIKIKKEESEFIINGKVYTKQNFSAYRNILPFIKETVFTSYCELAKTYDIILIEGAGSPVEINRESDDISNMWATQQFNAPVLLITDCTYGGSFAAISGTIELLNKEERKYIKGFIFNNFDGNIHLLDKGIKLLNEKYGITCYGTLPHLPNLNLPEEDSITHSYSEKYSAFRNLPEYEDTLERLAGYIDNHIRWKEFIQ